MRTATTLLLCLLGTPVLAQAVSLQPTEADRRTISVKSASLYPEGITYNPATQEFLLGSFRRGGVVAVSATGTVRNLVTDERLRSVAGIRVDVARNRLLVTNSDVGQAERSTPADDETLAALATYDLTTGRPLQYVDLQSLRPGAKRFVNDLDVDAQGNVYLTDSLAAAIYRVTPAGEASVFLTDPAFTGPGFNLNGIQVHPDGYLLVVKKFDGRLFRVPLNNPSAFTEVRLPKAIEASDGIVLDGRNGLIAIANQTGRTTANIIYRLTTTDGWVSAQIAEQIPATANSPSTGVMANGRLYLVSGFLHQLGDTLKAKGPMREDFLITQYSR